MATNLSLKIDVSKIDKSKLFVGDKGVYLDCVVIVHDEPNQYGNNGMIVQDWKDKPRDVKGEILGNMRYIQKKSDTPVTEEKRQEAIDDLPF
jgi:hypothetical protein